jgi:hypothetical protein
MTDVNDDRCVDTTHAVGADHLMYLSRTSLSVEQHRCCTVQCTTMGLFDATHPASQIQHLDAGSPLIPMV